MKRPSRRGSFHGLYIATNVVMIVLGFIFESALDWAKNYKWRTTAASLVTTALVVAISLMAALVVVVMKTTDDIMDSHPITLTK